MADYERDGSIEIEGRGYAWRALGDGPTLLLVQGYAGTADDWDPGFVEALSRSFFLLAPDNRGMGASALGDPDAVTIDSMASDLVALLDALDIDRVPVLGFSMGGFIAQALVARAPERVESLALLSTDPGGPQAVRAEPANWERLVDHSGTPRERASRTISVLFPPDVASEFDREFGDLVATAQAALDPAALAAEERAMEAWWQSSAGPSGGSPGPERVLILHGAEDVVIPPGNAELLADRFPGARKELFAGSGHAFMAQHPGESAELIRAHAAS